MRPSFLIIGAMKAATTTLFRDLGANPEVFLPEDKEPDALATDDIFTDAGIKAYESLFANARPGQVCGEASTSYTKRPAYDGVAARARRVLGAELKLIYLVRDPVDRIISQHHHWLVYALAGPDIDREVRINPEYVAFSKYAWQLEPWLSHFPRGQILIIRFEDYLADRQATVDQVSRFIGTTPRGNRISPLRNYNPSDNRRIPTGYLRQFSEARLYRKWLRPWLSWRSRERLRTLLLPKAQPRPAPPSAETVSWLTEQLAPDVKALGDILGMHEPLWERWNTQERSTTTHGK